MKNSSAKTLNAQYTHVEA